MPRVLIWMSPEAGHITPTVKFARDLLQKGFKVYYLTCGKIRQELEALGFDTVPFLPFKAPFLECRSIYSPCGPARTMYDALRQSSTNNVNYFRVIKEEIHNAAVGVNASLALIDGVFDSRMGLNMKEALNGVCQVARVYIHLPYRALSKEEISGKYGPLIYLSPVEFEVPACRYSAAKYTEACIFPSRNVGAINSSLKYPSFPKTTIYCSLGTQVALYSGARSIFEYIATVARAMPKYHFVINTGGLNVAEIENGVADNVSAVDYIPHATVLSHSLAAIIHGGFGTVKDCIYYGVPMIVLPQQWDQPMNAARVQYHGLGLAMDGKIFSSDQLRQGLEQLLIDSDVTIKMKAMQNLFRAKQAATVTADLCEKILQDGNRVVAQSSVFC